MRVLSGEFLLIDLGNTHAKLRLASPDRLLGRTRRLPTASLLAATAGRELREALAGWRYQAIVVASVVPAAALALPGARLDVGARLDIGVDLRGYPGLRTLGADRLADLAGAWALHGPGPLIVADLGTAAVFNAVDAQGNFLGGVIAPGLAALHASLPARAAQLPLVPLRGPVRALGRNTREALLAGAVHGYRGLVSGILAALRSEMGPARIVATGGDAPHLPGVDVHDPDLTLHGLRIIATRNRARFRGRTYK